MAKLLKESNATSELNNVFSNMGGMCIFNIIASVIFCLAITIAYENQNQIKKKIDSFLHHHKIKSKSNQTKDIKIEIDDNIDNIAKENECPICFNHVNKNDKQCPKWGGAKLK